MSRKTILLAEDSSDPRASREPRAASCEPRDVADAYRLGCNSYVRKPVHFSEFLEVVRQLSQYWLNFNETSDSHSVP